MNKEIKFQWNNHRFRKFNFKVHTEAKQIAKAILGKIKSNTGGITFPDFKLY
jgi:hypothetical protein